MRKLSLAVAAMVTLSSLEPAPAAAQEKTKLAVLDLTDKGIGAAAAQNLTDILTVALNELGVFEVLSRADIQQIVMFEQDKQLLGCESDTSCLAEIGGALGVALLVHGSVGRVGSTFIINLALTSAAQAKVLAREQREVADEAMLTEQVRAAARYLVRELLADALGYLILQASESGADVEIDGHIVGVTPLPRQNLAGGPHTLRVKKAGFVSFVRDIEIVRDTPTIIDAAMVPSLEFIAEYDGRANTWRRLAYIAGGVAVVGMGVGAAMWLRNGDRADTFETELLAAGCATTSRPQQGGTPPDCGDFAAERDAIRRSDTVAQVVGFSSLALFGVAAYLFFEGPAPGIYDLYKPADAGAAASAGVAPTLGGGLSATVAGRF